MLSTTSKPDETACLCEAIQEFADAYFVRTGGQSTPVRRHRDETHKNEL